MCIIYTADPVVYLYARIRIRYIHIVCITYFYLYLYYIFSYPWFLWTFELKKYFERLIFEKVQVFV